VEDEIGPTGPEHEQDSPPGSPGASPVDAERLRREVRAKYRDVAAEPDGPHHFHTGRRLAARLGYPAGLVAGLPDAAVESFAGVGNPFSLRALQPGERVVDVGSGAGLDCLVAAAAVGPEGRVVGVDMTPEMLAKARSNAEAVGAATVEFREGLAERLPVEDRWADVVVSNGVINLCPDKRRVLAEVRRVLRPGGVLQFADIANGRPVPEGALRDIDLWTG
jgi:arsenite methyltransferase